MTHRFEAHDAMASALIERGAFPLLYTAFEGGEWRRVLAPRIDARQPLHSLAFSDGRQWDEHNGWRNPVLTYVPREAIEGRVD